MKLMSQTDRDLINQVAELWVDAGGDSEGVDWCLSALKERIDEVERERQQTKEDDGRG